MSSTAATAAKHKRTITIPINKGCGQEIYFDANNKGEPRQR